jgi:dynein intermediate chain
MFKTYYDEEDNGDSNLSKRSLVSSALEFVDENSTGRAVTSLEWSLKHHELLLAAFSVSDEFNINQSNGLIQLWSLAMRKTPEFTFTCQTEVTSAIFHKFNPKLVVGATYTGQILIWDTRGKSLPINKTPAGAKFHSHPIYCLGVTGTPNANNIVSVSNDGFLCTWSLSNLSKPIKELKVKKRKIADASDAKLERNYSDDIGAICLATQENESNNIFIGSDDSEIYQVYVHQGNDNVENVVETYKKHTGPVTSLQIHPGDYHKNFNVSRMIRLIYYYSSII